MPVYFVDSSGIAKRYIREIGSAWVSRILRPDRGAEVYVVRITAVEVVSAIARRVKSGGLGLDDGKHASASFKRDLRSEYNVVEITEALVERAVGLADKHALRGYDAVQLAGALEVDALCRKNGLPPAAMVSADAELNEAAALEGLVVEDPNSRL
jgi:hypothetical protein